MRPHRRLLCPWDSPGRNTGVGCHFLLQCMKVKSQSEVAQSCPTLRDPMDCSPPGFSVHGIFQARVLEWVAIAFSLLTWEPVFLTAVSNNLCFFLFAVYLKVAHKDSGCVLWSRSLKTLLWERQKTPKNLQKGKESSQESGNCREMMFLALPQINGRRRQWHPTSVLLPGKSHGWRSLVGCSPRGC